MGGLVNTSIRFKDGEILNNLVYTSAITHIVSSSVFLSQDKAAIKKMLKELKSCSWDGKRFNNIAPYQYGLLVVDFQNDVIIDMQNYCELGQYVGRVYFPKEDKDFDEFVKSKDYIFSDFSLVVDLFLNNNVISYTDYDVANKAQSMKLYEQEFKTVQDVKNHLLKLDTDFLPLYLDYKSYLNIQVIEDNDIYAFLNFLEVMDYPIKEKDIALFKDYKQEIGKVD
jgi:hypothetical protein